MSERRTQILERASVLFADKGYDGVSIAELGAACGMSGPALYKHFRSKQSILGQMLVSVSQELLTGGRRIVREAADHEAAVEALVAWHTGFALRQPSLIVVQDRDWASLPVESREKVRELQRAYVEVWVEVVRVLRPGLEPEEARAAVHATFGLLNSTPHSALVDTETMTRLLERMGRASLLA